MKAINRTGYVPILKWRQGEYQGLFRLDDATKTRVTPLVEICPVEWDFELLREAKTLDQHLEPFGKRLGAKWGARFAFVDAHLLDSRLRMRNGDHPLTHLCSDARRHDARAIPVVRMNSSADHFEAAQRLVFTDRWGVCLRVDLDDLMDPDLDERVQGVLQRVAVDLDDVDIVVDMGAPNFEPLNEFAALVASLLDAATFLEEARSFALAGTSFPDSLASLPQCAQAVPRKEWQLYKEVLGRRAVNRRVPTFGDYGIAHPVLAEGDMRLMKPSANIRYTIEDSWCVVKGKNVRDHGFEQYTEQCRELIRRGFFAGAGYSAGDKFIEDCALRNGSTGNLSTWRWVGTNHHITRVVRDLANLHAS
jgi:hypothetical protein